MTKPALNLLSLATCIDYTIRCADSIGEYDDPTLPDDQRALARLAIHHIEQARQYVEKLKELTSARP